MSNLYLNRYTVTPPLIDEPPEKDLGMVITIPSYKEEHLLHSLKSLFDCAPPSFSTEVIVLINYSENDDEKVIQASIAQKKIIEEATDSWQSKNMRFYILLKELPRKHAGVGMARKIIMDEAVRRLESVENEKGIVVAFDADCTCEANYLLAIEHYFKDHPKANGCSIYFEHKKDSSFDDSIYQAVYEYEIHLRSYIDALRWCRIPHAFQTIGSSMAVNHKAYQRQGGMNRKKAGEDFYFLHRIIPLGQFGDLTKTIVYPSIRPSDRVPFGTGKAVNKWQESQIQLSYNPASYPPLKEFINKVENFFTTDKKTIEKQLASLQEPVAAFLKTQNFIDEIGRINKHSNDYEQFRKQFFQWFNGFLVMKYLHYVRDHYFPMVSALKSASQIKNLIEPKSNYEDLLKWFRTYDRNHPRYLEKL